MIYTIAAIVVVVVMFVWWRYTSVARGARHRDEQILSALDPIGERLSKKEAVEAAEIDNLAQRPQYRPMLHQMLKHFERLDLFPETYITQCAQAQGALAYWLMHPNELQDAPEEIECIDEVHREHGKESITYIVLRYRMPPGHWAEKDGWLLGLAGPFLPNDVPYSGVVTAFSRCGDKEGEIAPAELIDWWLGMLKKKGA